MKIRYRDDLAIAQSRSKIAFWLIVTACLFGITIWFLFGKWNSPLSLVILASMFMGAVATLMIQAFFSAKRRFRHLCMKWNQPRSDKAHHTDVPHIVSKYVSQERSYPTSGKKIENND
jgi:hypothetical protein